MPRGRKPKLTPKDVKEISRMYHRSNWTVRALAHAYKTTETTIHNAIDRKGSYKSVPR